MPGIYYGSAALGRIGNATSVYYGSTLIWPAGVGQLQGTNLTQLMTQNEPIPTGQLFTQWTGLGPFTGPAPGNWGCAPGDLYCWIPKSQQDVDDETFDPSYPAYIPPTWEPGMQAAKVTIPPYSAGAIVGPLGGQWVASFPSQSSEYWVQFRIYETAAFQAGNVAGKRIINWFGASCSSNEVTLQLTPLAWMYENCGQTGYNIANPDGDNPSEIDSQPGGETACYRHNQPPGVTCWAWQPDKWCTVTINVSFFDDGSGSTGRTRMWAQYDDEPSPTWIIDFPSGPVTQIDHAEYSWYIAGRSAANPGPAGNTIAYHQGIKVTNTPPTGFAPYVPPSSPPWAMMPSPEGPHIATIQAMAPNELLDIGIPAADPVSGRRTGGRSYTPKAAYSDARRASFHTSAGQHGGTMPGGFIQDDITAYDMNAHIFRFGYVGSLETDVCVLDADGFEVGVGGTRDGQHVPWCAQGHSYNLCTYDTLRDQWCALHTTYASQPYFAQRATWLPPGSTAFSAGQPYNAPWTFDPTTDTIARIPVPNPDWTSRFEGIYEYMPHLDKFLHVRHGQIWFYDPNTKSWAHQSQVPNQPNPSAGYGYDQVACYDPVTRKLYGGFGADFRVFDVDTMTWSILNSTYWLGVGSDANLTVQNDGRVVSNYYNRSDSNGPRGIRIYDPTSDTWTGIVANILDMPNLYFYKVISAWYASSLDRHYYMVGGESLENQTNVIVYRTP